MRSSTLRLCSTLGIRSSKDNRLTSFEVVSSACVLPGVIFPGPGYVRWIRLIRQMSRSLRTITIARFLWSLFSLMKVILTVTIFFQDLTPHILYVVEMIILTLILKIKRNFRRIFVPIVTASFVVNKSDQVNSTNQQSFSSTSTETTKLDRILTNSLCFWGQFRKYTPIFLNYENNFYIFQISVTTLLLQEWVW